MRVFRLSVLLFVSSIAFQVSAAVYTWEDEKGVVGFTEDFGSIPQKYRKKAKLLGGEDDANAAVVEGTGKKEPDVSGEAVKPGGATKQRYAGKDENYWREEFARARYELKNIRSQIDAIDARLARTEQMSRSEYRMLENSRKLFVEQELAARKSLDTLKAEAAKAGVPPDLR